MKLNDFCTALRQGAAALAVSFLAAIPAKADAADNAQVFKGIWETKKEWRYGPVNTLTIDFYKPIDVTSADCDGKKFTAHCNGVAFLDAPPGYVDDYCTITRATVNGNEAEVEFTSRRDCGRYKAKLVYDPENRQITVTGVKLVKPGWSTSAQTMLENGMTFFPQEKKQK